MTADKAKFLIAMPSLKDSIFAHSVILMAEQTATGALGFIINLPTGTGIREALKMMNVQSTDLPDIPILFGGPVQTDFFWFLHSPEFSAQSTIAIHPNFALTSAMEIIPILNEDHCPKIFFAGVGYSGWGAEQLEREIEEGSWWLDKFDVDLLFGTSHSNQWDKAFKTLGVDPETLFDNSNPFDPIIN